MILGLLTGLPAGCTAVSTECDWTEPIRFGSQQSVDWLLVNDRQLLSSVVSHNETREEVCR